MHFIEVQILPSWNINARKVGAVEMPNNCQTRGCLRRTSESGDDGAQEGCITSNVYTSPSHVAISTGVGQTF
jgi:hypothetical protein